MALSNPFNPPPNTQIVKQDAVSDSIWRRWFEQLWKRVQTGSLGGTVTSVGLSMPTDVFDVTNSPVTSSGTLTVAFDDQTNNTVFAGPATAPADTPAFRALVAADIPTNIPLTIGVTPIVSGTTTRVLYEGADNLLAEDADFTFDGTTLTVGGLNVTGNTILGDASGDALTINAGTWTYGANWTATRAAGALGAGTTAIQNWDTTFTGDASGNTTSIGVDIDLSGSGSNAITASTGVRVSGGWAGGATNALSTGLEGISNSSGAGGTTAMRGVAGRITKSGAGNVTNADALYARTPSISGAGTITTGTGLHVANPGNASVTTAVGVLVDDITSSTNMRGIQSAVSSGANKFNAYFSGTADNAIAGNVRIGSTTAPTVALDVTGAATISSTLTPQALVDISGASAGQIKFPATQNASSNANTLDDYEEGTWTPGIAFGGGTTGITYSQQVGSYTKIGERCLINGRAVLSAKGSSTGNSAITGLPFTTQNVTNQIGTFSFTGSAFSASANYVNTSFAPNVTTVNVNNFAAGANAIMSDAFYTNTTSVNFCGNYPTA